MENETSKTSSKHEPEASKASHSKFIGLFLITGSVTLFVLWFSYDLLPSLDNHNKTHRLSHKTKKSGLQRIWQEDIKEMFEKKLFHKGISSVRLVRVFMLDQNLHSQLKYLKAPFKQKQKGQNLLEVSFMSHHSDIDETEKLIIQYNLTDKDSGNMFWEHSRTITIPKEVLAN